jgi:hypothetical protein
MAKTLTSEEQKKAAIYSLVVCLTLLLFFFLIRWQIQPPTKPVIQDLITIDLGKDDPGHGEDPPLVKGNPTPEPPTPQPQSSQPVASAPNSDPESITNDNDPDAAPIVNPKVKSKNITPTSPTTKTTNNTNRPKVIFPGNNNGKNGNNPDIDNDFKSQGKTPGENGDEGSAAGKIKTIPVSKSMMQGYQFQDELGTEKIYAKIKVDPNGNASWVGFEKKSTSRDTRYRDAIIRCLPKIKFEKESTTYQAIIVFDFKAN